jgi:hypothetical protein
MRRVRESVLRAPQGHRDRRADSSPTHLISDICVFNKTAVSGKQVTVCHGKLTRGRFVLLIRGRKRPERLRRPVSLFRSLGSEKPLGENKYITIYTKRSFTKTLVIIIN